MCDYAQQGRPTVFIQQEFAATAFCGASIPKTVVYFMQKSSEHQSDQKKEKT